MENVENVEEAEIVEQFETKQTRQLKRAEERAMLRRLLTKKDRRDLSRIKDTDLRNQIIAEIFNKQ